MPCRDVRSGLACAEEAARNEGWNECGLEGTVLKGELLGNGHREDMSVLTM